MAPSGSAGGVCGRGMAHRDNADADAVNVVRFCYKNDDDRAVLASLDFARGLLVSPKERMSNNEVANRCQWRGGAT